MGSRRTWGRELPGGGRGRKPRKRCAIRREGLAKGGRKGVRIAIFFCSLEHQGAMGQPLGLESQGRGKRDGGSIIGWGSRSPISKVLTMACNASGYTVLLVRLSCCVTVNALGPQSELQACLSLRVCIWSQLQFYPWLIMQPMAGRTMSLGSLGPRGYVSCFPPQELPIGPQLD